MSQVEIRETGSQEMAEACPAIIARQKKLTRYQGMALRIAINALLQIYSTDRKNEANKMFIMWLLPVWGTGNKCRTRDLTII